MKDKKKDEVIEKLKFEVTQEFGIPAKKPEQNKKKIKRS
jgi:hypothetical protein